jgi:hypothetical protein
MKEVISTTSFSMTQIPMTVNSLVSDAQSYVLTSDWFYF